MKAEDSIGESAPQGVESVGEKGMTRRKALNTGATAAAGLAIGSLAAPAVGLGAADRAATASKVWTDTMTALFHSVTSADSNSRAQALAWLKVGGVAPEHAAGMFDTAKAVAKANGNNLTAFLKTLSAGSTGTKSQDHMINSLSRLRTTWDGRLWEGSEPD